MLRLYTGLDLAIVMSCCLFLVLRLPYTNVISFLELTRWFFLLYYLPLPIYYGFCFVFLPSPSIHEVLLRSCQNNEIYIVYYYKSLIIW